MQPAAKTLVDLEKRFWKSIVEEDTDTALSMLTEPALMVSTHGAMKFDHKRYREMAEKGSMVLKSFELKDVDVVFPSDDTAVVMYRVKQTMTPRGQSAGRTEEMVDSSTWIRKDGQWLCVMHTETPVSS